MQIKKDMTWWEIKRESLASDDGGRLKSTPLHEDPVELNFLAKSKNFQLKPTGNLCMKGKLIPELYVLGAMKASTTSLAAQLDKSTTIHFPFKKAAKGARKGRNGVRGIKELHFFDQPVTIDDRPSWLEHFNNCSRFNRKNLRAVTVDATPAYLRKQIAAKRIASFYGPMKSKVKFAVILREPLGRAQSAFHHLKQKQDAGIPQNMDFNTLVDMHLKNGTDIHEIMWGSQYAQQLESYFQEFDSSQFFIAPFGFNIDPHNHGITTPFVEELWNSVDANIGMYRRDEHKNIHSHPPLEQDLEETTLTRARANYSSISKDLAKLLATSDAKLFGYTATIKTEANIQNWLENGW